jgi:ParB-like chromosome segregation protein Spo0J
MRCPAELRLHPALAELKWSGPIEEINESVEQDTSIASRPIHITTDGIVLAGIGRWRFALLKGRSEIQCIEYPISEEEQLQFILDYHKPRLGWNSFVRIRLALTLEPSLQRRALDNMRQGGKLKGLANLPEPSRIDVRKQIAQMAAAGARNVSNVKVILQTAHTRVIDALSEGALTINRAMQLCQLPPHQQVQQFVRDSEKAVTTQVIRRCVRRNKQLSSDGDVSTILERLRLQICEQPGSVVIRASRSQRSTILLSRDLFNQLHGSDTTA